MARDAAAASHRVDMLRGAASALARVAAASVARRAAVARAVRERVRARARATTARARPGAVDGGGAFAARASPTASAGARARGETTATRARARGRGGRDGGARGRGGRGARTRDAPRECREFDDDVPARRSAKKRATTSGSANARRATRDDGAAALETADGFEDYAEDYADDDDDDDDDDAPMGTRTLELADQGRGANVKSVEFVQACVDLAGCPKPTLPEIAVIGRSNVGKSSLVNMLTNRKSLAKTSKNPGKTQTINHYRMTTGDGKFYLVDLPGYGYANAPEDLREKWAAFTREYLIKRESLITVLLLIDSTVKPQRLDLECLDWLGEAGVPVTVVFTKVDKRKKVGAGKRANPAENVEEFCREVSEYWDELPPMLYTSSANGEGKREVLNHIATLRQFFKKPLKEEVLAAVAPAAATPVVADARARDVGVDDGSDDASADAFDDDEPEDDWN